VSELTPVVGLRRACVLSGRSRASHYRAASGPRHGPPAPRCSPPNQLTETELAAVLELLHLPQFVDLAPAQVWAILLDAGRYVASISTMYRVLRAHDEIRERRRQATHPARGPPRTRRPPTQRGVVVGHHQA
jgi:putative transposase